MVEAVHQQLFNELFCFVNKSLLLTVASMKRDWRDAKTFLLWVREEKKISIVPMDRGDVTGVFGSLALGIKTGGDFVMVEGDKNLAQNYNKNGSPPATQCCRKFQDIAFCVLLIGFA